MTHSVLIFLSLFISIAVKAETPVIRLLHVVGQVRFENTQMKTGDQISKPGVITVGSKSSVDLLYPEGHKIRLKAGAELAMTGENRNFGKILTLRKGQSYMHFQKHPETFMFEIKTATAVAGVRGTEFLFEEKNGSTYLCVCEGVVEMSQIGFERDGRMVKAGQDLWAHKGKTLGQPADSPSMNKVIMSEFESMKKGN